MQFRPTVYHSESSSSLNQATSDCSRQKPDCGFKSTAKLMVMHRSRRYIGQGSGSRFVRRINPASFNAAGAKCASTKSSKMPVHAESIDCRYPSRDQRKGRIAKLRIRTTSVVLDMIERPTRERYRLPVNVVEVLEFGTTPHGEEPIHWRLFTNHAIATDEDVALVLQGYAQRWRIEDLHRTWKSGACRVEDTQLRSTRRVIKWAMIMAASAARIERIKHLARTEPSTPASVELTPHEIAAILLMKRKYKKRTEVIPESMPTIEQITIWIAELGGYTGKSSGGPPGSVTIKRGLDFILPIAEALALIEEEQKMR